MRPSDATMIIKRIITWTLAASAAGLLLFYGMAWFRVHQRNSRAAAYRVQCAGNLREMAKLAMIYADSSGKGLFPFGEGESPSAHESLNVMVRFFGSARKLNPKLFICPEWRDGEAAEIDEEEKYELDESSLSYTWTDKKLSPTDAGFLLSSDKYIKEGQGLNGHEKGMQTVGTDTSITWVLDVDVDGEDGIPKGLTR